MLSCFTKALRLNLEIDDLGIEPRALTSTFRILPLCHATSSLCPACTFFIVMIIQTACKCNSNVPQENVEHISVIAFKIIFAAMLKFPMLLEFERACTLSGPGKLYEVFSLSRESLMHDSCQIPWGTLEDVDMKGSMDLLHYIGRVILREDLSTTSIS